MDFIDYLNIFIGVIDIMFGVLVLKSNPKKDLNNAYFLSTLSMGLWSVSLSFYSSQIILDSVIWLKIAYVFSYLMAISQLYFIIRFNGGIGKKLVCALVGILMPLFSYGAYVLLFKNTVILNILEDEKSGDVVALMGKDYLYYAIPIFISITILFCIHLLKGREKVGLKKKQSTYYWIAGSLWLTPLIILDFVLPLIFHNTVFYRYSTLGNILWVVIMAYSIYYTKFLDVRIVLGNLLDYLFRTSYIFAFVFVLIYLSNRYSDSLGDKSIPFLLISSFLFAFIFNLLSQKTEKFIQSKYVYSVYNPAEKLQKFSGMNSEQLDLKTILGNTIQIINETVKPKSLSIILFNNETMNVIDQENSGTKLFDVDAVHEFISNWDSLNSNPNLVRSEIEGHLSSGKSVIDIRKNMIVDFMNKYGIEMVLPFEFKSNVGGILILNEKADNSLYSFSDRNFLESIIKNANIAIGRAYLYSELQSFNQTLQQKVDLQTKELQVKILELQEARQKENDMIDIMGHELRTPATIVKLNAQLLDKFDKEIDSDPEAYKRYVDRIKIAVENEIKLINTLLSSAKLEGDKIVIEPEEINIREEIEMAIHGNEREAKDKNLPIINNVDQNTPNVFADKARVVEVLNNLVSNGVKYTDTGSVTVSSTYNDAEVEITIADTGKGISKEDLPKLGQKFYRVSNYTESSDSGRVDIVRPGGTGLGLFVTFNLIRKMGGDVRVESELGKGSKFIFTLPRYNGQKDGFHKTQSNDMFEKLGLKK